MIRFAPLACTVAFVLSFTAGPRAQTLAETIRASVKTGQRVVVTADTGEEVKGRIINLSSDAMTIREERAQVAVPYAQILRIEKQRDGLLNGVLIGFAVGAAVGATAFSQVDPAQTCESIYCLEVGLGTHLVIFGGLGTVAGAAIDAVIYQRERTVFSRTRNARISVAPEMRRGGRGVSVSIWW